MDGGPWQVIREDYAGWQEWAVHAGQDVAVRVRADNGTVVSPWSATVRGRSPFTSSHSPTGIVDSATRSGSTITLSGWAFDQDGTVPINLHAYTVAGTDSSNIIQRGTATVTTANLSRPDIAAAYPGMGAAHGFTIAVPAPTTSTVCLFGIDHTSMLGSNNPLLACVTL
ncbi:MAG: hypothetical protein HGA44_22375 [Cellulomonadaceae bacterium]|nr:hypothetical protein [Cellulomonadaceae bacterium]